MRTAVRKNSFVKVLRLGFLTVLLSVLLCMAMPWAVFAGEQRVFDNAKLFDASEKEELEQKLSSFREEWQMDLGVLTTESTGRKTVESFADDFYDQQGMGEGSSHSGALIVIDMGSRELYISTLGDMADYLTDERIEAVLDSAYGYASEADYAGCAAAAVDRIASYMDDGVPAGQYDYIRKDYRPSLEWYEILFAAAIAAAAAVMPCIGVINQYKMKKERRQSLNYHFSYRGSSDFKYDVVNDMFINKMVTQRRIPRNTGGSGPGGRGPGSFAGRTTLHRSSSGRMHGGGGRKF